ncbi:MAG: QueT transporter family protein [Syntrophobacterales bacterium]
MREVWCMWRYSTMVVLTVLTAGLFAAILIPFKGIPLIPGITELRPANVIPLVFGLLFGPAGAWGSAFGNLIGDFFGTLGSLIAIAVFLNNVLIALSLGPFLLKLLAPRVSRWDLSWEEQMAPEDSLPGPAPRLGLILAWVGAGGGYALGLAVSTGLLTWASLPPLSLLLAPFLGLLLLGCWLM